MNTLQLIILLIASQVPPETQCRDGHRYGHWFKQSSVGWIPEQPAHICRVCGFFQFASGRWWELEHGGMTAAKATEQVRKEYLPDFGTFEKYQAARAENRR